MMSTFSLAVAAAVGAVPLLLAPAPASAATQLPFAVTETVGPAGAETFTATAPFCAAGTFQDTADHVVPNPQAGRAEVTITSVYTCADGSGTFTLQKKQDYVLGDGVATYRGPVKYIGGTGAYAFVSGHGTGTGQMNADGTGSGRITGTVLVA